MCNHAKPSSSLVYDQIEDLEYSTMDMPLRGLILLHPHTAYGLSRNNSSSIQRSIERRMTVQQPMHQESL